MIDELKLIIPGCPIALQRHRTAKTKAGFNINYDPSSADKQNFLWKAIADKQPAKPYDEPIRVTMLFFMQRPKNHFRTGKFKGQLKENAPKLHTVKPDLDNLEKFVKDALNKVYWRDDSVISTLIGRKIYSERPRTEIKIETDFLT